MCLACLKHRSGPIHRIWHLKATLRGAGDGGEVSDRRENFHNRETGDYHHSSAEEKLYYILHRLYYILHRSSAVHYCNRASPRNIFGMQVIDLKYEITLGKKTEAEPSTLHLFRATDRVHGANRCDEHIV